LGELAVALGIVSVADLKADPVACTLRWREKAPPPCPREIGVTDRPPAEPLKRFAVEVPQGLLTALVFRHHEIRHSEQTDLIAVMAALTRIGLKPTVRESSEGERVFSF
jgi:hypothetical protein